ncbi:alpha/beta hydrolase [Kaarinaea lacus]
MKKADNDVRALRNKHNLYIYLVAIFMLLVSCASPPPRHLNLMPAPDVYNDKGFTPFVEDIDKEAAPYRGMLYATDRSPAGPDVKKASEDQFYTSERGHLLRFGIARIELGKDNFSWEEARKISLAKNRPDEYPLKVTDINELGVFYGSYHQFVDKDQLSKKSNLPATRFAELINKKLVVSHKKDIFIYIPGYKVVFENPVLVATELWHYLGYEGAFIAFSWPSTPKRTAYFSDAETTLTSAVMLRRFLEYLAQYTNAERINIIAYSQGTRLITEAMHDLALLNYNKTRDEVQRSLRLGNVVLVGSDIDRDVMGAYIVDGLLKVPEHLTVYASAKDKALEMSKFFFGRSRVGQMFAQGEMPPATAEFLFQTPEISVVNVTDAEGSETENGHRYFRKSPWASSDILMTLRYDLLPADRGLVRSEDNPIWTFPPDYIARLRSAIVNANPALKGALEKQETENRNANFEKPANVQE